MEKAPSTTITQEMIEAGVFAAREHTLGEPLADLVTKIYLAMLLEAPPERDSASATRPRR